MSNKVKPSFGFLINVLFLLSFLNAYAGITNDTYEASVIGPLAWAMGEQYSDGKRLFSGDPATGKLQIFNNIPTTNTTVSSGNINISGFLVDGGAVGSVSVIPCVVGNKLLVGDSDPVAGWCIRVWNSIPDTNTTASSCNYKITGFSSVPTNFQTDGTRFSLLSGNFWIWDSVPEGNADTSSRSAWGNHYAPSASWFGTSGKFYIVSNGGATNTYYVDIYDSVPVGYFTAGNAQSRITFTSQWDYNNGIVEMRNILYLLAYHYSNAKTHVYVWRNIPTTITADTTMINDEYSVSQNLNDGIRTADLHNFYMWNGDLGNVLFKYNNNYDTFTVSGNSMSPVSIDQRHLDQAMENVKIYTSPGKTVLNSIKLNLTGSSVDADVTAVKLYHDANSDGAYTQGTDVLIKSGTFSGKTVTLNNLDFWIDNGEKNVLITFDIGANAVLDNTVGVNVEYMVFEKRFYEYPSGMSSSQSTIVSSIIPNWKNEVRVVYTQSQAGSDTQFTMSLDWDDASGGAPPLIYKISHLVDDSVTEILSETVSYKIFANLEASKKHKFKVKVIDLFGNETAESNFAFDETAPEWSGLFKIQDASSKDSKGEWQYKIKLIWEPAKDDTSKDVLYEAAVKEEGKDWTTKTTWENSAEIAGLSGVVYIKIRARDSVGNYTQYTEEKKIRLNPFLLLTEEASIGSKGGTITLNEMEAEKVQVEIPEGAMSKDYTVVVEKIMDGEYTYRFSVYDSKGVEKKVLFNKPVTIKFTYNDDKLTRIGYKEEFLHVLYFDGLKWIKIGGEVNTAENTVKVNVYHFSMYRMSGQKDDAKSVLLSSQFITPNDDEINDALFFNANWNYTGNMTIKIYDINGKQVWGYYGNEKSCVWKCRDGDGRPVEQGIYLYVITVENMTFNGSVVVAK